MSRSSLAITLLAATSVVAGLLVATTSPNVARADSDPSALADSLFAEGKKLMDVDHDYAAACPKLAESQRLRPGGGTALRLALCYELLGKPASALARFREALAFAVKDKRDDRRQEAEKGIARVEPHVSFLEVRLREGADVAGLVVALDGQPIERPAFGTQLAVDPGKHEVHAEAPSKEPFVTSVVVEPDGDHVVATIEPLVDAPKPPPIATPAATTSSTTVDDDARTKRTIGWIVGGVGVASLGVGAFLGIEALKAKSDANDACSSAGCGPESDGPARSRDAVHYGNAATITLAVGVVAVASSAIILLTTPSTSDHASRSTTPAFALGTDGKSTLLSLYGAF